MITFTEKFGDRVTITSALPYVNGVKHLGNIVGSILPADIFHRFLDLFNVKNIFICGTDDHGTAVEIAALEEGLKPEEYADKYHKIQKEIYEKWSFDFTYFGRTSSLSNHKLTKDFFLSIYENGYIRKEKLLLPFCKKCERFLPDRFIIGECPKCGYEAARGDQCENCGALLDPIELKNPLCTICKKKEIEFRKEEHLFLDFKKLEPELKKWISKSSWPSNVKNFALGWIKEGLKPRCITRNLKWGVRVPLEGYEHLRFYVWFDAPIGYISITMDAKPKNGEWKKWWTDSKIYHFLGKDNIPFHTVFWPGMLIAAKMYSLPYYVAGYEYLNWENQKFSTSKGIGLFSDEALDLFPADYWRFYLSSILPETSDSNFDWNDFRKRINNELIANYGNLFYRVTHFIENRFESVPKPGKFGNEEEELKRKLEKTINEAEELVKGVKLREALKEILSLADSANRYFQKKEPWEAIEKNKDDCATTLYIAVNVLRTISTLLYPYIPATSEKALKALNTKITKWSDIKDFIIKPGHKIRAEILFKKVEDDEFKIAKNYKTKYLKKEVSEKGIREVKGKEKSKELNREGKPISKEDRKQITASDLIEVKDGMIPFSEFSKLDLRIGTITEVKDHPDAEKLYILQVDLGTEKRQLVAGLKEIYRKEELNGKQIIVICNLEPKEFKGVKSEGMLLASEDGTILSPEKKVENGSKVM